MFQDTSCFEFLLGNPFLSVCSICGGQVGEFRLLMLIHMYNMSFGSVDGNLPVILTILGAHEDGLLCNQQSCLVKRGRHIHPTSHWALKATLWLFCIAVHPGATGATCPLKSEIHWAQEYADFESCTRYKLYNTKLLLLLIARTAYSPRYTPRY